VEGGCHPGLPCHPDFYYVGTPIELIGIEPAWAWDQTWDISGSLNGGQTARTHDVQLTTGDTAVFSFTVSGPNQVEIGIGNVRERPGGMHITRTLRVASHGLQRATIQNISGANIIIRGTITINSAIAFDAPLTLEIDSYMLAYESLDLGGLLQRSSLVE